MARGASLLLAALMLAFASLVAAHTCIHDELLQELYSNASIPEVSLAPVNGAVVEEPVVFGVYNAQTRNDDGYKPIRIAVFTEDLFNPAKYCTRAGQLRPNFKGKNVQCTEDDILTFKKKSLLVNQIIKDAVQLHADRLLVQPITDSVKIPKAPNYVCAEFTVPSSHRDTGVTGSDFFIYLSAGPTTGTNIAWATPCGALNGRPVVGMVNVSPKYISASRSIIRVIAHEILHTLGFTGDMFAAKSMTTEKRLIRGKEDVLVVSSSSVVKYTQAHYGCNTAPGMELEDQGGSGTAGSHWKRRNAKDELMAGIAETGFYTAITIAAMEDTGYYKGNYDNAEHMGWGYQAGCPLLDEKCVKDGVTQYPGMFCTSTSRDALFCASDRTSLGTCNNINIGKVPVEYQYFPGHYYGSPANSLMDYCPYVQGYNDIDCSNGEFSIMPGSLLSGFSRCFSSAGGLTLQGYSKPVGAVCAKVTCDEEAKTYTVRFAGSDDDVPCPVGEEIAPSDSSGVLSEGTVTCPTYDELCLLGDLSIGNGAISVASPMAMLAGLAALLLTTLLN